MCLFNIALLYSSIAFSTANELFDQDNNHIIQHSMQDTSTADSQRTVTLDTQDNDSANTTRHLSLSDLPTKIMLLIDSYIPHQNFSMINKDMFTLLNGYPPELVLTKGMGGLVSFRRKNTLKPFTKNKKRIVIDYEGQSEEAMRHIPSSRYLIARELRDPFLKHLNYLQCTQVDTVTFSDDYKFGDGTFKFLKGFNITELSTVWTPHLKKFIHSLQEPLKLKHLEIRNTRSNYADDINTLCTLAQHTPNLRTLKLYAYKRLDYKGYEFLPNLLKLWSQLEELDIVGISVAFQDLIRDDSSISEHRVNSSRENFLQALLKLNNLHTLKLRNFSQTHFNSVDFCKYITEMKTLRKILFDDCKIDIPILFEMAEELKHTTNIQEFVSVSDKCDSIQYTSNERSLLNVLEKSNIRKVDFVSFEYLHGIADNYIDKYKTSKTPGKTTDINYVVVQTYNSRYKRSYYQ